MGLTVRRQTGQNKKKICEVDPRTGQRNIKLYSDRKNKNTRNKNKGGQENNKVGRQGTEYKEISTGMYKRSGERKTERRKRQVGEEEKRIIGKGRETDMECYSI